MITILGFFVALFNRWKGRFKCWTECNLIIHHACSEWGRYTLLCKNYSQSQTERCSFEKWKMPFCIVKGAFLMCKRRSFAMQKGVFYKPVCKLLAICWLQSGFSTLFCYIPFHTWHHFVIKSSTHASESHYLLFSLLFILLHSLFLLLSLLFLKAPRHPFPRAGRALQSSNQRFFLA